MIWIKFLRVSKWIFNWVLNNHFILILYQNTCIFWHRLFMDFGSPVLTKAPPVLVKLSHLPDSMSKIITNGLLSVSQSLMKWKVLHSLVGLGEFSFRFLWKIHFNIRFENIKSNLIKKAKKDFRINLCYKSVVKAYFLCTSSTCTLSFRFDHYAVLCDLLPVALPTLAICLSMATEGENLWAWGYELFTVS